MAMQGYGYFAVNGGPDEALPPALRAAIQHRYLPQAFPQDGLDEPVSALRFRQLMLFACAGRNHLPQVALSLVPAMQDDDTVTGQNAVYYALTLEAAATGARQEQDAPQDGPAGS